MKIVVKTRFRTDSAYSSNGINSFIEDIANVVPEGKNKIF